MEWLIILCHFFIYILLVFQISMVESQSSVSRYHAKFAFWKRGISELFCSFSWGEADICIHLNSIQYWHLYSPEIQTLEFFPGNGNVCFEGVCFKEGLCLLGRQDSEQKEAWLLPTVVWGDFVAFLYCFTQWLLRGEEKECRGKELKSHISEMGSNFFSDKSLFKF